LKTNRKIQAYYYNVYIIKLIIEETKEFTKSQFSEIENYK